MRVQSLGQEDSLEEGMATHCSVLTWEIHEQSSLVGYSPWDHKEMQLSTQACTFLLKHGTLDPLTSISSLPGALQPLSTAFLLHMFLDFLEGRLIFSLGNTKV